jgi:hypothetical protein
MVEESPSFHWLRRRALTCDLLPPQQDVHSTVESRWTGEGCLHIFIVISRPDRGDHGSQAAWRPAKHQRRASGLDVQMLSRTVHDVRACCMVRRGFCD